MPRLALTVNGETNFYILDEHGLTIGRALENAVVLNHAVVSRRHALVELRGQDAWVRDLDSRNGVFVNRLRVQEAPLGDGDLVQIGPFELLYQDREGGRVVLDDQQFYPISQPESRKIYTNDLPAFAIDFREFSRISRRLNGALRQRELLDAAIEEVIQLVPAQRAALLLLEAGELVSRRILPPSVGDLTLSSTIVRAALDRNEAVLTRNALLDFAGSESIIQGNIRSALCVPLIVEGQAIGVIYVDSPGQDRFHEDQRDLLAALAHQVAINLERTRLSEAIQAQTKLMENLERFMSPNVARLVASHFQQHGQFPDAEELPVTVLFADVKGFTALAEQLSPREAQDLLNEYFHEMTEVIFRYQGTLDKYIGDGIMAVFGAPRIDANADVPLTAIQAVDAALEMLTAHQRLLAKLEPAKLFAIRIGINSGLVYAGFFGTTRRLEYTVIGDAVNVASRLEGKAEPNSILIGEETSRMLGRTFVLQAMGELQLKGKAHLVRSYKVLGRHANAALPTLRPSGTTPF